jgi:zinc-binding alcohol dehydrogenase family protein
MKAFGYRKSLPLTDPEALIAVELPDPVPGPRDLKVEVRAVSVNPADVKIRATLPPPNGELRVLGYDAAGVVTEVGDACSLFKPGDEVFYAGAMERAGTNSQYHLVDERLVGHKPKSISFAQAAALPLTSITAWEIIFDRLGIPFGDKSIRDTILVINGAGGVGSILTQMARRLTGATVVATASRPETVEWCGRMGAHHVINHHQDMAKQLEELGLPNVRYVAGLTATAKHLPDIERLMAPHGHLALIDDPPVLDIMPLKRKCLSVHWELMFTPSLYQTPDMDLQHRLLEDVCALVDAGVLKSTLVVDAGKINLENLKRAHLLVEQGKGFGKVVLNEFDK